MSDPLEFGPDRGLRELWLFTLFVPSDDLGAWEPPRPGQPPREWPLEEALGAGPLEPSHVQVVQAADLGPGGLRKFLSDAHGMDGAQVEADAGKLDALQGTVAIVLSGAIKERPGRFSPKRPVNFIGRYSEAEALAPASPAAPRAATRGHVSGPSGPGFDTPKSRRALVLTLVALLALALLILALF